MVAADTHLMPLLNTVRLWRQLYSIQDRRLETHDTAIQDIIEAIKELMAPERPSKRGIGFQLPPGKT